jgi:hypothetical protein
MTVPDKYIKFGKEFNGEIVAYDNNMCVAMRIRDLEITIQGHLSKSPLVLGALFSYEYDLENNDQDALCLIQIPVTENEINLLVPILKSLDFKIDSLNNRWIKVDPPIYYVNAHVIDDPTIFAINVSHIFSILKL